MIFHIENSLADATTASASLSLFSSSTPLCSTDDSSKLLLLHPIPAPDSKLHLLHNPMYHSNYMVSGIVDTLVSVGEGVVSKLLQVFTCILAFYKASRKCLNEMEECNYWYLRFIS